MDANNYWYVAAYTGNVLFREVVAGVANDTILPMTISTGQTLKIVIRASKTRGRALFCNGVKCSIPATPKYTPLVMGPVVSSGTGIGYLKSLKFYSKPISDNRILAVTT